MLSYYFPPTGAGGVQRSLKFAKYLPDFGFGVTVITPKPISYLAYDSTMLGELPLSVNIVRVPSADPARILAIIKNKFSNRQETKTEDEEKFRQGAGGVRFYQWLKHWFTLPDAEAFWLGFAYNAALRQIVDGNVTAIYSTSPPASSHLLAYLIKKKTHIPWVADFRDLWADHYDFIHRPFYMRHLIESMERAVFMYADLIICNTPGMQELYEVKYPGAKQRLRLIPNGYDEEDFAELKPSLKEEGQLQLVHMGALRGERSLAMVLNAIKESNQVNPKGQSWILEQIGSYHKYLESEVRVQGLGEWVQFKGNLSHHMALEKALSGDALLLLVSPKEGSSLIPAKLYEYLRLSQPQIVVAPPGDAANLASRIGGARVFSPEDVHGLAAYLAQGRPPLPQIDRQSLLQYERKNLTQLLVSLLEELSPG